MLEGDLFLLPNGLRPCPSRPLLLLVTNMFTVFSALADLGEGAGQRALLSLRLMKFGAIFSDEADLTYKVFRMHDDCGFFQVHHAPSRKSFLFRVMRRTDDVTLLCDRTESVCLL
jgi:hypothetical protein